MQIHFYIKLLFAAFLALSSVNKCCIQVDAVWATNLNKTRRQPTSSINYLTYKQHNHYFDQKSQFRIFNIDLQQSQLFNSVVIAQSNPITTPETEPNPQPPPNPPSNPQPPDNSPQLEGQPSDFPQPSPPIIEELLDKPSADRREKLERLRQLLQQRQKPNTETNGIRELELRVRQRPLQQQSTTEANDLQELQLRVRPRPLPQKKLPSRVAKFKPIGSLQARVGYFQSSNIFSSAVFPREDGLIFYGLSLASAYFPVGSKTYINGAINGNLIRYIDQSRFNYNQVSFNVGIYQQLSSRMYAQLNFNNQQLFYANSTDSFQAGDRFLDENSVRLSLGRRDLLNPKLTLDSFYEFSANFSEPNSRSRLINSFWLSLNYYVQKPLQVGINYQFNLSDFTERQRDDQYHRLFGHVIYRVSESSNLNLQSGINFGDSTDRNIDFNSWFLSIYYSLKVGEF